MTSELENTNALYRDRAAVLEWTLARTTEAAALAIEMLKSERAVSMKADGTIVTNIDRAVERFLRDAITTQYPDHAILGEEYGLDTRTAGAPLWSIDPIDGTVNLANDLPHWGVSVGLMVDGEPLVGVVVFPLLGETYAAARDLGATLNGAPLAPLGPGKPTEWEDTYGICSTSVRRVDFAQVPARLRVLGSAALEVCWVSAGKLRGCHSIGVSLWDVAAGLCIAHEVGVATGWHSNKPFTTAAFAAEGKRENDMLIFAPPATLAFLKDNLVFR
jgi:myo-inositol-1(or 4)-monophosphatase